MPTIRINDVDLHYEEHGSGPEPIVFEHGFLLSSKIWQEWYFPRLPDEYHAYALDLRGHGGSHRVKHGCNLVQLADDLHQFALHLGFASFLYVGVSMGGGVGIQLALNHPEVLKGMVLMNGVTGLGPLGHPLALMLFRWMAGKRRLLAMMLKSAFVRRPSDRTMQLLVDDAMLVTKETLRDWTGRDNRMQHLDRLPDVRVPTLVIIGGEDKVVPADWQHRLAATLPNAEKVVFDGEGHLLPAELPEDVFAAMAGFLERCRPK